MIVYTLFGFAPEDVPQVMAGVLDVMRKHGVSHELSSVEVRPELTVVNAAGQVEFTGRAIAVPAFDQLRVDGNLEAAVEEISNLWEYVPVMSTNAPVVAFMNGQPMR